MAKIDEFRPPTLVDGARNGLLESLINCHRYRLRHSGHVQRRYPLKMPKQMPPVQREVHSLAHCPTQALKHKGGTLGFLITTGEPSISTKSNLFWKEYLPQLKMLASLQS